MTGTIHRGLSFTAYSRLPGWSWSVIRHMADSPRHVQHARTARPSDTASRAWLRAVHCLVLEPHHFARDFSVFDGTRRGKLYDAHVLCHPGATVLNPREYDSARAAADAVRSHPAAAELLAAGDPEVSITWQDEVTGLPCKARVDWLGPACLADLKTLGTTDERAVARHAASSLYHGQIAHYDAGLRACGLDLPAYLVVAEGKGAQDVAVYEVDAGVPDGALHVGRELRAGLMARLAECVAEDRWPGRHEGVQSLCLPQWALLDVAHDIAGATDTEEGTWNPWT